MLVTPLYLDVTLNKAAGSCEVDLVFLQETI
jgi:hypothetical protein